MADLSVEYSCGKNPDGSVWLNLFLDNIDTSDRDWASRMADAAKAEAIEAVRVLAKEVAHADRANDD